MGRDGNTTISGLTQATSIASNDLFDHAAGTPSAVYMSDFLTGAIGRDVTSPEWAQGVVDGTGQFDTFLGIPQTTIGGNDGLPSGRSSTIEPDGSVTIDDGYKLRVGDKIWVRVGATGSGEFFAEQIGKNTSSLKFTNSTARFSPTGARQVGIDGSGRRVIDIELEVTGYNAIEARLRLEDGMNTDASNYGDPSTQTGVSNTDLVFTTDDVKSDTVFFENMEIAYSNKGGGGSYVDCAGDPLDGGNTSGDLSYSVRVETEVNNPAQKFNGTTYVWVYMDDDFGSLDCPPATPKAKQSGSALYCLDSDNEGFTMQRGTNADVDVRVVLTDDDSSSLTVLDERLLTLTPEGGGFQGGTGDEGLVSETYTGRNSSTNC